MVTFVRQCIHVCVPIFPFCSVALNHPLSLSPSLTSSLSTSIYLSFLPLLGCVMNMDDFMYMHAALSCTPANDTCRSPGVLAWVSEKVRSQQARHLWWGGRQSAAQRGRRKREWSVEAWVMGPLER